MKKTAWEKLLSKIPYIRYAYLYRRYSRHRPGHFYSPVVDLDDLHDKIEQVWPARGRSLHGINLNTEKQKSFAGALVDAAAKIPFPEHKSDEYRYHFDNKTYEHADGLALFATLLHYKPKRVIEIGSGFSSSLMLDTNEKFLNNAIHFTFIEPNPEINLARLLRSEDYQYADVRRQFVQDVHPDFFRALQDGDILMIDNSHVSKTGSDVNYLMTEILPVLNKGVIVHIHDIFFPFEYPKEWIFEHKLNWNEIYTVHNFLLFNNSFEIILFSDQMQQELKAQYADAMPLFFKSRPSSLWIRKTL